MHATRYAIPAILLLVSATTAPASAQEVWSGTDVYFEKPSYADWTDPENQDRITASVWITRKNTQGIFNIAQEKGYTRHLSPTDTEWATGDAVAWESLTFQSWEDWAGGVPPNTVGVDAVVHLISDDVYLDIRFESWVLGDEEGGGGFAYRRASDPTPVRETTWGRIKAGAR